jgi:tetratricopeptide (TPR) repeat protein
MSAQSVSAKDAAVTTAPAKPPAAKSPETVKAEEIWRRGWKLMSDNKPKEALPLLDQALRVDPRLYWGHFDKGKTLVMLNRVDDAIKAFSQCIKVDPTIPNAYNKRAETYLLKGDAQSAIKDYTSLLSNPKDEDKHLLMYRARAYEAAHEWDKAFADWTKMLSKEARNIDCVLGRARDLAELGKYKESMREYATGFSINPKHGWTIKGRGDLYLKLKQYDKALADYNQALLNLPDHAAAPAYEARAALYDILGKKLMAASDRRVAKFITENQDQIRDVMSSGSANDTWRRGNILLHENEAAKALPFFNSSLRMKPNHYWGLYDHTKEYIGSMMRSKTTPNASNSTP